MSKIFSILCLSNNIKLVQFLDKISALKVFENKIDFTKALQIDSFHFLIIDHNCFTKLSSVNAVEEAILFINKTKDIAKDNPYIIIFSDLEPLDKYLQNNAVDDFIPFIFAENILEKRLLLLYNKRFWEKDKTVFFYFQEEIEILTQEIDVYLARMQGYFINSYNNQNKKPEETIPSSFAVNMKKTQIAIGLIYLLIAKNIEQKQFFDLLESIKSLGVLYGSFININFKESFSFSSLSFVVKKSFSIICLVLLMSFITDGNPQAIEVSNNKNLLIIQFDKNKSFDQNLSINVLLIKLLHKLPNLKQENNSFIIKI